MITLEKALELTALNEYQQIHIKNEQEIVKYTIKDIATIYDLQNNFVEKITPYYNEGYQGLTLHLTKNDYYPINLYAINENIIKNLNLHEISLGKHKVTYDIYSEIKDKNSELYQYIEYESKKDINHIVYNILTQWINNLLRKVSEVEPEFFTFPNKNILFDFNLLDKVLKNIKYEDILNQLKANNIQITFNDEILNHINLYTFKHNI